ncbi:MAG: hypothetical protein BWY91_03046 [bacterium ADurb.BinA028]|nr:MAG: hypothetical protein BWY91_03046 [bacterium ADurb.BinA028]
MADAGGQDLQVLGGRGGGLQVGLVALVEEGDCGGVLGVVVAREGMVCSQRAGLVGVGAPSLRGGLVDGDGDVGDGVAVGEQ